MKALAFCVVAGLAGCAPAPPLETLGQVPRFDLTSQNGQAFDSSSLMGHVWVADFMYTTCPGPCPMMSRQMDRLQHETATSPDVKLVSFTVDPAHDTPTVLAAYSKHFQADPRRWYFLTGDAHILNSIGKDAFKLNSVDGSLVHSIRFTLVDRKMRIRGYYSTDEDGFLQRIERDIRRLEHESS